MRRLLPAVVGLILTLGGGAAAHAYPGAGGVALSVPVSQSGAPAAQLMAFACTRNLQPKLRWLSVTAVMRPVAGTVHMQMRFELLTSQRRWGRYQAMHGPNLGVWVSPRDQKLGSHPDDQWQVPHPVVGPPAPAFYKLRVSFRWLGKGGKRLAQYSLGSPVCHQLELRPDLVAGSLAPPTAAQNYYLAVVNNEGLTGAGSFDVRLNLPDGTTATHHVVWLGAHRTRQIQFAPTACPAGSSVTLTVDPGAQVDDFDRANNTLVVACPTS